MIVYVMVLDYFYDDYKRPEGSSEIIGVCADKLVAYKTVLALEYEKNYEDRISSGYKKMRDKLEHVTLEKIDKFYYKWADIRDEYLGPSEFGSWSTGYRAYVSEQTVT